MFDILLYLYDHYLVLDPQADADALSRKLTAAGFESGDIDRALDWLTALDTLTPVEPLPTSAGVRVYAPEEQRRIAAEGLSFLSFLESAGQLSPAAREWVLDSALALEDAEVSADKLKWIALLAISRLRGPGEALWLEDLVRGADFDDDAGATPGEGWTPTLH